MSITSDWIREIIQMDNLELLSKAKDIEIDEKWLQQLENAIIRTIEAKKYQPSISD